MHLFYKKCAQDDLDQLVLISRTTFSTAFEADNNPDDFKTYIDFAFHRDKLADELNDPNTSFYFVYLKNDLVAYFKLNENEGQSDLKGKDSMELERIYVLHDFQGKGLGKCILQEIKRLTAKAAKAFLWLGVWEQNKKAIKFYEENRFYKFGTHPYFIGKDKQLDWLMRFDLINFNED
jgi:ribosomal protein S18 acetylase RimI-like enzyme